MKHLALIIFAILSSLGSAASAQVIIVNFDVGQQNTKYGSSYDATYTNRQTNNNQFADLGATLTMAPHSQHKAGYNFVVSGDFGFPFENDNVTGGILSVGGSGTVNFRYRTFAIGSGLDVHYYTFPAGSTSAPNRPSQTLVGVPVIAKLSFGPAGRAYVQGGGSLYVASSATTGGVDSLGDYVDISNAATSLSNARTSGEIRASAGYMFKGRIGLRANYVNRNAYFDVTSNPTSYPSYFDFHEQTITGGLLAVF